MKTKLAAIAATISLALSVAPLSGFAQGSAAPSAPAGAAQGKKGKGERHPHIRQAMHALENAKKRLQEAAHDYAGHRVKAIEHIDQALSELQQALQSDKQ